MENEERHDGPHAPQRAERHIPEKDFRIAFVAGLGLKAIGAVAETGLGFLLLFTGGISGLIVSLIQRELIEDPNDFFASHLSGLAAHMPASVQLFGAFYLISHGVIKLFLVWGLVKNKLWAYPASIAVFALFIVYQVIRFASTHSIFLVLLTLFDLAVLWLIWHEYRYLLRKRHIPLG